MQVRHDEGVAIRIDPEPCAAVRKGDSEASLGECIGQPLSLAKSRILGADAVAKAEGNTGAGHRPSYHANWKLLVGIQIRCRAVDWLRRRSVVY